MELRLLKTFQCVASCLNFSKAAELLNFSQPTVSTQIQTLEEELGQKLFVHVGKKTYLTPQGIQLKKDADRILGLADEIQLKFQAMNNTTKKITVAAHESFCNMGLPQVINQYLKSVEKVNIELTTASTNDVIDGIRKNDYDVGIISGEINYAGINCLPIDSTKVEVFVSKEIKEKYSFSEIVDQMTYFRYKADAMQYSLDLNQALLKSGIIPKNTMKFGSLIAIKEAVLAGLGYTVFSRDNVLKELEEGSIVAVTPPGVEVMSMTSAIFLEDNYEREEVKQFVNVLKEVWIG